MKDDRGLFILLYKTALTIEGSGCRKGDLKKNRQNRSFHYCAINVQTQGESCQHNIDSKIKYNSSNAISSKFISMSKSHKQAKNITRFVHMLFPVIRDIVINLIICDLSAHSY